MHHPCTPRRVAGALPSASGLLALQHLSTLRVATCFGLLQGEQLGLTACHAIGGVIDFCFEPSHVVVRRFHRYGPIRPSRSRRRILVTASVYLEGHKAKIKQLLGSRIEFGEQAWLAISAGEYTLGLTVANGYCPTTFLADYRCSMD